MRNVGCADPDHGGVSYFSLTDYSAEAFHRQAAEAGFSAERDFCRVTITALPN